MHSALCTADTFFFTLSLVTRNIEHRKQKRRRLRKWAEKHEPKDGKSGGKKSRSLTLASTTISTANEVNRILICRLHHTVDSWKWFRSWVVSFSFVSSAVQLNIHFKHALLWFTFELYVYLLFFILFPISSYRRTIVNNSNTTDTSTITITITITVAHH